MFILCCRSDAVCVLCCAVRVCVCVCVCVFLIYGFVLLTVTLLVGLCRFFVVEDQVLHTTDGLITR